jgi:hypothetical protein
MNRLPGFAYLYGDPGSDIVTVRVPSEGLLGLVGKKNAWRLNRRDPGGISKCRAEIFVNSPYWVIEQGIASRIEQEIERWQFPEIYEAMSAS